MWIIAVTAIQIPYQTVLMTYKTAKNTSNHEPRGMFVFHPKKKQHPIVPMLPDNLPELFRSQVMD